MSYLDKLNDSIGESFVGKFFQIKVRILPSAFEGMFNVYSPTAWWLSFNRSEEAHFPPSLRARRQHSLPWLTSSPSTLAFLLTLVDPVSPTRQMVVSFKSSVEFERSYDLCFILSRALNSLDLSGIFGETYEICLEEIKRQYVTATALSSMVGTFLFCLRIVPALVAVASHALTVSGCLMMGLFANLPVALAPGMFSFWRIFALIIRTVHC